jgi:uncharacterized protein (DUF1501 family)
MKTNRRQFLTRLAVAAAVPGMPRLNFAGNSTATGIAGSTDEPHTLICIFLRGGADTLNLWVPYADDHYYRLRPTLSIKAPGADTDAAIRVSDHYALHPMMRPLEAAFKEGRFGAVQSVGVKNDSGSHFECQDQMEHGNAEEGKSIGGGWLGRFLRGRMGGSGGPDGAISPLAAVALGTVLPESLRGAPSASVMQRLEDISLKTRKTDPEPVLSALKALYDQDSSSLGKQGGETMNLFARVAELRQLANKPEHDADYPRDDFGSQLNEVARLIKARLGLQIACVDLGNWDTHFFQGNANGQQAQQIKILAEGLMALDTDLQSHRANYTVMVTTEFGRRTYENASLGTDHGRGFTFMALGDRVNGGQILGDWPVFATDQAETNGPGGIEIKTEYRSLFAEVLRTTLQASDTEMAEVFPDGGIDPVGLMMAGV